jgi:hypothetical protein
MQRLLASCVIAAVAGAVGCADTGDEAMFVQSNLFADTGCRATPGASSTVLSHGSLDVLTDRGYTLFADVESRITALVGQGIQRTISLSGANIDIAFPGSTLFSAAELADLRAQNITHFKYPLSGSIPPGGAAAVPFELIPLQLVERIFAKVDLSKQFRLETLATFSIVGDMSGEHVSSQPFTYAVTIGNQVSVNITGNCSALPTGFMPRTGYACNKYQDGVVDCCLDSNLVCPTPASQ